MKYIDESMTRLVCALPSLNKPFHLPVWSPIHPMRRYQVDIRDLVGFILSVDQVFKGSDIGDVERISGGVVPNRHGAAHIEPFQMKWTEYNLPKSDFVAHHPTNW